MSVKEHLHELVDKLGDEGAAAALAYLQGLLAEHGRAEQNAAARLERRMGPRLVPGRRFAVSGPQDLRTLAAEQGVQPVTTFEDLLGDFWPEDETADEFVATVRRWRCESGVS